MRIVVLDPIYLTDALKERLSVLGDVTIYDDFPKNSCDVIARICNAQIVITASTDITKEIIQQSPHLRLLTLGCTGTSRIDLEAANDRGVVVTNVPAYATDAVAEHVFSMLLALLKNIRECDRAVRNTDFDWRKYKSRSLKDMTFGIIGYGKIGKRVATIAQVFGARVIVYNHHYTEADGEQFVTLRQLLELSDIISLHVPLTEKTNNMIRHYEFHLMQKKPIIINTARGKIINHDALIEALQKGLVSGAGLDVYDKEPAFR